MGSGGAIDELPGCYRLDHNSINCFLRKPVMFHQVRINFFPFKHANWENFHVKSILVFCCISVWKFMYFVAMTGGNAQLISHFKTNLPKLNDQQNWKQTARMRIAKSHIAKHILIMSGITAILALSIVYPFLPGEYDSLATPLSIFVQIFGAFGLLLSLVGLLWLAMPKSYYFFATTALYITTFIVIVLASVAFLSTGKIPGIVIIAVWIPTFFRLKIRLRKTKKHRPK